MARVIKTSFRRVPPSKSGLPATSVNAIVRKSSFRRPFSRSFREAQTFNPLAGSPGAGRIGPRKRFARATAIMCEKPALPTAARYPFGESSIINCCVSNFLWIIRTSDFKPALPPNPPRDSRNKRKLLTTESLYGEVRESRITK